MLRFLLMSALTSMPAAAAPLDLLVGAYTTADAAAPGIYVYRFDAARGRLSATPAQAVAARNPSWLVVAPDGRNVYAVNENGAGDADPVGRVSRLELDARHRLVVRESVASLSDHPTHASLAPDGRYLFVANYSVQAHPGGLLAVVPLDAHGRLRPVTQVAAYQASAVDPQRQASSHVHAAALTPDGRYVLVADLGGDRLYRYRYAPADHPEHPLVPADPPFLALPPGSGPRHLAFSADGRRAWLTLEMRGQVAELDLRDGRLALGAIHDLHAAGFAGTDGAGALHLSADGRFLYVVNRGEDNRIVVFAVDPDDGHLTRLQARDTDGANAREFTFSPDGRFLLIAVQGADAIVVVQRDPATGLLGPTVQRVAVHAPAFLQFLPPR
ncbi:lactonase family protein [Xanthomonas massiliensis]|uniref:lactonase family protein n=1 Tax=Xanthomonas massiliensis TaxID=1720302 RepID=UPI000827105B|nr:lactonase family protein [Xanthomonas massiliensis]